MMLPYNTYSFLAGFRTFRRVLVLSRLEICSRICSP